MQYVQNLLQPWITGTNAVGPFGSGKVSGQNSPPSSDSGITARRTTSKL